MQGSGGLLTEYSFGVCRGPADFRLNIQLVCAGFCYERPKNVLFISSAMTLNYEPEEEPAKGEALTLPGRLASGTW
jgi:hypothetical protein